IVFSGTPSRSRRHLIFPNKVETRPTTGCLCESKGRCEPLSLCPKSPSPAARGEAHAREDIRLSKAWRARMMNSKTNAPVGNAESRRLPLFETLRQDLRYTLRTLRRDAGFTTFAILIVGLGIGASSTIFSVVNALLLRPLPFKDPGQLVWIANNGGKEGGLSGETVQVGHFTDVRARNKSFSDMAAYFAFYGVGDSKLTGDGEPERLSGVPVSQNFFQLLGVKPQIGRLFTSDECKWNGPKAVLSNGLWKRRFVSDPSIVGKSLTLDGSP